MKEYIITKTPIDTIDFQENTVYIKNESKNLSGSIKDRVFNYLIRKLFQTQKIYENQIITLASSGNAAISLVMLCNIYNLKPIIFLPSSTTIERIEILKNLSGDYFLIDGNMEACNKCAEEFAKRNNGYFIDQFNDKELLNAHEDTFFEIINEIKNIDLFITSTGTGVTLSALGKRLKSYYKKLKINAYELNESRFISGTLFAKHKIEGIGPKNNQTSLIDKTISFDQDRIFDFTLKNEELDYGLSTLGAFIAIQELNIKNKHILIIGFDNKSKYLSAIKEYKQKNERTN